MSVSVENRVPPPAARVLPAQRQAPQAEPAPTPPTVVTVLIAADAVLRATWARHVTARTAASTVDEIAGRPSVEQTQHWLDDTRHAADPGRAGLVALLDATEVPGWISHPSPAPADGSPAVEFRAVVHGPAVVPKVQAALRAGARGYFFPDAPSPQEPGRAAPATDGTGHGGKHHEVVTVTSTTGTPTHLTRREVDILQLVADGATNKQVADQIGLSPLTVKSHLTRISHRLHADDRAHLVLLALRAGAIH
jgi:DNA-binding CsgD family transcriptional regulator